MQRRNFLKSTATVAAVAATGGLASATNEPVQDKEFYEFRIYQLTSGNVKSAFKAYFTDALMPLCNKLGIKVGVFEEYDKEDPPKIYTLFVLPSYPVYFQLQKELSTNVEYLNAAKSYFELPAGKPVFERYDTFLTEAFDKIPQMRTPDKTRGLLELRTYESYNEDAGRRKITMFNDEEINLFDQVGLHAVFFSKILAGKFMPALMYMLWFKDMDERDTNWKKFSDSPEWKAMSAKPIYADTVSKVRKKFLTPTDYSQI